MKLVTGGAGFIGSKLIKNLLKNNHEITTIDNLSSGHIENIPESINFINGDIFKRIIMYKFLYR